MSERRETIASVEDYLASPAVRAMAVREFAALFGVSQRTASWFIWLRWLSQRTGHDLAGPTSEPLRSHRPPRWGG